MDYRLQIFAHVYFFKFLNDKDLKKKKIVLSEIKSQQQYMKLMIHYRALGFKI